MSSSGGKFSKTPIVRVLPFAPDRRYGNVMFTALLLRYALIVFTLALWAWGAEPCANMAYGNRNQVDYGPLRLKKLRGNAIDQSGVPVPGVCVGLFKESDHSLIAATATLANGEFALQNPPRGDYRLVEKSGFRYG